jgi:hypothetical protein
MKNLTDTFGELRRFIDSNDPFMNRGHKIRKRREGSHEIPEWTKSDETVQQVLLASFPKWKVRQWHRNGAARWVRVIHLYYRMNMTQGQVAEEMDLSLKAVNHILTRMNKVATGLSANGRPRRPRGRKPDVRIEDSSGRVVSFDELFNAKQFAG